MKNIYIIGCGGIGSNVAKPLAKFLGYHRDTTKDTSPLNIVLIDGDYVEKKNLSRQSFIYGDLGKNKAQITAEDLESSVELSNAKISSVNVYLKPENIAEVIEDDSVLFVGVDNYITRRIIEEHTKVLNNVVIFFGANEYDDGDVNIVIKENNKYLTPLLTEKHPEVLVKDRFPDEVGCEEAAKSAPQIIPTNLMAANLMLGAFYSWISKKIDYHEVFFNVKTGNTRFVRIGE